MSSRARDWSLRRRFTLAASAAAVLLAVLSGAVVVAFIQLGRSQSEVTVTLYSTVRSSSALLSAYLDQETGVRGYALTGERAFLEPYLNGAAEADRRVRELRAALRGRPDLSARLTEVVAAARSWREGYAEPVVRRVEAGGPPAAGSVGAESERGLFDAVRTAHARFETGLLAARAEAAGRLETGRRVLALSFLALALLVVTAGLTLGLALRRWILLPLDAVGHDVRGVADGDLEQVVTPVGPPELRRLGSDVERMRRRIVHEYQSVRSAHRIVEQQQQRLEEQTEELRRSNAELEQFAYVASHDLQEPLRKVASFTDLLRRRYSGQLDERADTYIDYAVDGARRMQALINDLLAFSRVGRLGTSWGTVDLANAAAAALHNLAASVEETGAKVEIGPLPAVPGDAGLLTQVFQNLIGNALKFHRPEVAPVVRISAQPAGDTGDGWRIEVDDNGIGIDPRYADRIFVIFTRLNRREDYPGSGIGLALAKKIVEYHGGHVGLGEHDQAPGATIFFTLPSADRRATENPRTEGE